MPSSYSSNKTTEYEYNLDGRLVKLTARSVVDEVEVDQETRWVYGTTWDDSDVASNELLRAKIYPDSDDTDDPLGGGVDETFDRVEYRYNALGQLKEQKDQNQTVHAYAYDALGRFVHDRVTLAGESPIDGTILRISRSYNSRGLLEAVSSHTTASGGLTTAVANEVRFGYNDFGQLSEEHQEHDGLCGSQTPSVQYTYVGGTNNTIRRTAMIYPNGRIVGYEYGEADSADDLLNRVTAITDDAVTRAAYLRLGMGTFVQVGYDEPGLKMSFIRQGSETGEAGDQYVGLDRFGRAADIRWLKGGSDVDRFTYEFDRASNRTWRRRPVAPALNWDEAYEYDGLYQLSELKRGDFSTPSPDVKWQEEFGYDPTGNWLSYLTKVNGSTSLEQTREHNEANEITGIDNTVPTPPTTPAAGYDPAGNMTTMPKVSAWNTSQTLKWDAWNRLVKVTQSSTTVGEYRYDGLTRRIWKKTTELGVPVTRHYYYSDQWQVLEERLGSDPLHAPAERQFLWGLRSIDDLICRDRFTGGGSSGSGSGSSEGGFSGNYSLTSHGGSSGSESAGSTSRLYATQDQWHVTALASTSGMIVERYAYDAFGASIVLDASFNVRAGSPASLFDWETRFGCYRFDDETQLYCVRYRYLHPRLGRWLSRDPIEEEGPSLYMLDYNNPVKWLDPDGRAPMGWPVIPPPGYPPSLPRPVVDQDTKDTEDMVDAVAWWPKPCGKPCKTRFIQIVVGGAVVLFFGQNVSTKKPFVDDGQHGAGTSEHYDPPYYPIIPDTMFRDSPNNKATYIVCRVCQCNNKIKSVGPCKQYLGKGRHDLGDDKKYPPMATPPKIWTDTVDSSYPGLLPQ